MGAPGTTKLTPEGILRYQKARSEGMPKKFACTHLGMSEKGLYLALGSAKALEEKIFQAELTGDEEPALTETDRLRIQLLHAEKKGDATFIEKNMLLIQVAAADSWQAAAWLLERRHPGQFARIEKVRVGEYDLKDGEELNESDIDKELAEVEAKLGHLEPATGGAKET